jgi:hypothetical protein
LVEQPIRNRQVSGSSPLVGSKFMRVPSTLTTWNPFFIPQLYPIFDLHVDCLGVPHPAHRTVPRQPIERIADDFGNELNSVPCVLDSLQSEAHQEVRPDELALSNWLPVVPLLKKFRQDFLQCRPGVIVDNIVRRA